MRLYCLIDDFRLLNNYHHIFVHSWLTPDSTFFSLQSNMTQEDYNKGFDELEKCIRARDWFIRDGWELRREDPPGDDFKKEKLKGSNDSKQNKNISFHYIVSF